MDKTNMAQEIIKFSYAVSFLLRLSTEIEAKEGHW